MKTVYLGMSGGVDSSVAALLLKQQGYHVVGIYMKNWSRDLPGSHCPWAEDLADAKRVAVNLDLDFEVWDFEKDYKQKVVDYMLSEFKKGRTPNPDVICNQEIKFNLFFEKALARGADYIATGHYAAVVRGDSKLFFEQSGEPATQASDLPLFNNIPCTKNSCQPSGLALKNFSSSGHVIKKTNAQICPFGQKIVSSLARAADENKDQTYFLYRIPEPALAKTIFPLANLKKPEVKKIAAENGLKNAYKKESMGVCFVGEVGMKDFLKEYIDVQPGEIREQETEKVLGYHEGAVFYTIGQRHGLYLGGGLPYYVVKKDLKNNIVYVSKNLNNEELWTDTLSLENLFLRESLKSQLPAAKEQETEILVRLRHRAPLIPATLKIAKNETATLIFPEKIKRPAAGQSAVFYQDKLCLGGGIISE